MIKVLPISRDFDNFACTQVRPCVEKGIAVGVYLSTPKPLGKYREVFKAIYTSAVMRGASIQEGIIAGVDGVRAVFGDHERVHDALRKLRARLGGILGSDQ
jgi:hypothetical protein